MFAARVGQGFGHVSRGVDAAERRREPDFIESVDRDVGGTGEAGVRHTGIETHGYRIEAGVEVVERLLEVVDAEQRLSNELRRVDAIQHDRVILHPAGRDLIVVEVGRADGSSLGSGAGEPADRKVVLRIDDVVNLGDAVVAVVVAVIGAEEVVGGCGSRASTLGPEAEQRGGDRVDRHAIAGHDSRGLLNPGIRRFRGAGSVAHDELLAFVGGEVEELVFDDRAAD